MSKTTYTLEVFSQKVGLGKQEIVRYVECQILSPFDQDNMVFDREDLGRITLIQELKQNCDPNDESLSVILHLIDQIHYLQKQTTQED